MIIYDNIYIYIFGFASVARNLNSEIHHMTQNTPKDGGGVGCSSGRISISPVFFRRPFVSRISFQDTSGTTSPR